jgi:PadR family transcriptional regulator PadR
MNIQLKKGIVEVCVLATLRKEPSYGYKIISDISEIIEISEST